MNIHHHPSYLRWKTGVEKQLYDFQSTQTTTNTSDPVSQSVSLVMPIQPICEVQWDDMVYRADQAINDLLRPTREPRDVISKPIVNMVMPMVSALPTEAMTFMQGRPGGPQQRAENAMRLQERQVTTHLQAKGTTSMTGQTALLAIGTNAVENNTENPPVINTQKTKRKAKVTSSKAKTTKQTKKVKTTQTAPLVAQVCITVKPPATRPTCMFGCCHGGLLDLIQMASKNTKYCLKQGNFFHGKDCVDCKEPIAELFATSNSKALFYYCAEDYRVSELDHETAITAPKPCDCILCITCYFKRDSKKQSAGGTAVRSSRRG
jgi:hypothetical protein